MDKYLSIITNFGCHYQCPECVVKNNGLKMSNTNKWSSVEGLASVLKDNPDINWVSVSGGGDPLFHLVALLLLYLQASVQQEN